MLAWVGIWPGIRSSQARAKPSSHSFKYHGGWGNTGSSDKDDINKSPFAASLSLPSEPFRPWFWDFKIYINTCESKLLERMGIVQWRGVITKYLFNIHRPPFKLCSSKTLTVIPYEHLFPMTIWPSWHLWFLVNRLSYKVIPLSANAEVIWKGMS